MKINEFLKERMLGGHRRQKKKTKRTAEENDNYLLIYLPTY